MKRRTSVLLLISLVCGTAACSFASNQAAVSHQNTTRRLVFIQTAPEAALSYNTSDPHYTLTLRFASNTPQVLYLSDQPQRIAGSIALKQFLQAWNDHPNGFKKMPPQAVLLYRQFQAHGSHGIPMNILTLHNPTWHPKSHSLRYTVTANTQKHRIQTGNYRNITLLVDRLVHIQ
jgi:hypothetical protein